MNKYYFIIPLLLLFTGTYIYLFWYIQQNIEVFQRDPMHRGMEMHNFYTCQCMDTSNNTWYINTTAIYRELQIGSPIPRFTFTNITFE